MPSSVKDIEKYIDELKNSSDLETQVKLSLEIAWIMRNIDPLEGYNYALDGFFLAEKTNDDFLIAKANFIKGSLHNSMNELDGALKHLFKADSIFSAIKDIHSRAKCLNKIGRVLTKKNQISQALIYYKESIELNEKENNEKGLFVNYTNIGRLYLEQKEYHSALIYFLDGVNNYGHIVKHTKRLQVDYQIGYCYLNTGQIKKSYEKLIDTLRLAESLSHYNTIVNTAIYLSQLEAIQENQETALQFADIAINYAKKQDNSKLISIAYHQKLSLPQFKEDIPLRNYCITHARKANLFPIEFEHLNFLKEYYRENGDFEKALAFVEEYANRLIAQSENNQILLLSENSKNELDELKLQLNNIEAERKKLLDKNQELELFAGKASHDLKEPLRMIKSFSEIMLKKDIDGLSSRHKEYLQMIFQSTHNMQSLLDDLLSYVMINNQKAHKLVNLNNTVEIVKSQLQLIIEESKAVIIHKHLPSLLVPSGHAFQLFYNLISNGIKFRAANVQPIIEIQYESDALYHTIAIKDNGIGIAKEDQERIFETFTRLHTKDQYEGSGLGLATCKKIIDQLNGTIQVTSTIQQGTTFEIKIPI